MLTTRLTNARVLTMDPDHPVAHDLGIWRGRIVGLDEAVTGLPAQRVIDLQGATVLPGFIDSHVHLAWTGFKAATPTVAPCVRVEDVLAVVAEAAARVPPGAWVDVAGYDQRGLGRHLTLAELDKAASGRKVLLMHDSGHGCAVSSPVLELLPGVVPHEGAFLAEGAMGAARALRLPHSQGSWRSRSDGPPAPVWPRASPRAPRRASAAPCWATARSNWAPTNSPGNVACCPCASS